MNILLAKPPFARLLGSTIYATYPLGLMGVASMLKAAGHDVSLYHDDVSNPAPIPRGDAKLGQVSYSAAALDDAIAVFSRTLDDMAPDVVGISYTTSDVDAARRMSAECRDRGIRTVAGGVHPSLLPDVEDEFFDCIVVGEGDVGGDWAFDANSSIRYTPTIPDGHDIPTADRDCVIGGERYTSFLRGMVQTQRGCPYSCAFCAAPTVFGTKVRTRDPGAVREEVESLGVPTGRIIDDSFAVVREHGLRICEELSKVNFSWVCDMAVRDVDAELLDAMAGAGCTQINVGLESAARYWRRLSGKDATLRGANEVLTMAQARCVGVVVYFMIGWPGETQQDLFDTLFMARDLKDRGAIPCISIVTPYPGTKLWDMCDIDERMSWGEFMHQSGAMGFADVTSDVWAEALAIANKLN